MKSILSLLGVAALGISLSFNPIYSLAASKETSKVDVVDKAKEESLPPEIDHITNDNTAKIFAYLKTPIPALDYVVSLKYGDNKSMAHTVTNETGIVGFRVNLDPIANSAEQSSNIANSMYIEVTDLHTGEITKTPVKNKEMIDLIKNVSQINNVTAMTSGDQKISGVSAPNKDVDILTYTRLQNLTSIATGKTDSTGKFDIVLPHQASGEDFYVVQVKGQYGETASKEVVVKPKNINENLFYNPSLLNQAEGWNTDGPIQTITNYPDGVTNFQSTPIGSLSHLGATQYKYTQSAKYLKISLDVNVHKIDSGSIHMLLIGAVFPGGVMGQGEEIEINSNDLNKWLHFEYSIPAELVAVVQSTGFAALGLNNMDIKNMHLTLVD